MFLNQKICLFQKKGKPASEAASASPPEVTITSAKSNRPKNGGGKSNSDSTMVAIGNPATMNDINRIHGSNSGNVGRGGGEEGNLLVNIPPQQHQKNSLNMTRTSNGNT